MDISLTIEQIENLKHTIGFKIDKVENGVYYAYRNFFGVGKNIPSWDDLVVKEIAGRTTKFDEVVYYVTDKGFELLSEILGVEITREEPGAKIRKGDRLGVLLDKADEIHTQMNHLFIKNGLDTPDLKAIPQVDRDEWYRLHDESDLLEKEIIGLINKNTEEQFL